MGQEKRIALIWIGLGIFICLGFTGCKNTKVEKHVNSYADTHVRLEWNMATTVDVYKSASAGHPWDAAAIEALTEFSYTRSGILDSNEDWVGTISRDSAEAVRAGCQDPMVNYLYIRYAMDPSAPKEQFLDAFTKTARNMESSPYPAIRKFYAAARTMEQARFVYGRAANSQPVLQEMWNMLEQNLDATLADKSVPAEEAYQVCDLVFSDMGGLQNLTDMYQRVSKPYFDNWPDSDTAYLMKGKAYIDIAWAVRGSGYADTVSADQWKSFYADLAIAQEALEKAWDMDSTDERIPQAMIRVCLGRAPQREVMEKWFGRAMQINPNSYETCSLKLYYLYPRWYGSREDMVEFGKECVASTNWGGNVPLILSDAHREYWQGLQASDEKTNYWKQPDVWPDIQASFERFFELNPKATRYYHNYAWYAYHCEQWDKLNELIPKLEPVNYDYFGGKDEYDRMVELAKEHAAK